MHTQALRILIDRCRYEPDIDRQIEMLYEVNSGLPKSEQLRFPSLFTDDYVRGALDIVEAKIVSL